MKGICILGATGSIGVSTLDVVKRHADEYRVIALTANTNIDALFEQCLEFKPEYAVVVNEAKGADFKAKIVGTAIADMTVLIGAEALVKVATLDKVHSVMAAIVGAAGLLSALAAAQAGKTVLLANKESLVMSGNIFMQAVHDSGAVLLPIDSEHNAIFQCMPANYTTGHDAPSARRILLTASGGPFRTTPLEDLPAVTVDQAVAHPKWDMGRKISVDSATMMNKGLELIEACLLFNMQPEQIQVVIHPQSIIHSMVDYVDGSVLAQMGNP
ncbi:MAG: 1-deoxy-D-xylulose-5-phosphate reductoisomerase, partial [Methyloprofundus sp.]|nr:1-deoxy-D-xylulose-5-phosphate reductoisomerase [Methyloprofundus sp.]